MVKILKVKVTMHIQTKKLIIIYTIFTINFMHSVNPWKQLAFDQEKYMDNRSGFMDYALYAFEGETPASVRAKIKDFSILNLSKAWSAVGGDECFALCTLAQSGNSEKLKNLLRDNNFTQTQLQRALLFAQGQDKFDFYTGCNKVGSNENCQKLLAERISQ